MSRFHSAAVDPRNIAASRIVVAHQRRKPTVLSRLKARVASTIVRLLASRQIVERRLQTLGELMRGNQVTPEATLSDLG